MAKAQNLKKRRLQRMRAKDKNPISAVKTRPKEDPRRVGLDARLRQHDLPETWVDHRGKTLTREQVALTEYAATVLGRLYLNGVITRSMYEAGKRYLELYQNHLKAISAPVGLAVGGGSVDAGETSEEYVEWAIRAVAHYEVMKAALQDYGVAYSVEMVVIGCPEWALQPHHIEHCRDGLTIIARKMGLEQREAA